MKNRGCTISATIKIFVDDYEKFHVMSIKEAYYEIEHSQYLQDQLNLGRTITITRGNKVLRTIKKEVTE